MFGLGFAGTTHSSVGQGSPQLAIQELNVAAGENGCPIRQRVAVGIAPARTLIQQIDEAISGADVGSEAPIEPGSILRAVLGRTPDGRPEAMPEPLIPLLDTTLLTNAPGEPRVGNQLLTERHSADRIDLVMAFIRRSGIAPLVDTLRQHCQGGRELRVLTTTYTGSTEGRALDALLELGAEVRVSYDTSTTRLHAKAWLFHRRSGFSTAYIGSSNLTHSAQVSGLEWNVRVSGARNPDVIEKVAAVFESYWNSGDFVPYDAETFAAHTEATGPGPVIVISPIELRPEPFQERLLEQIDLARAGGHHRNLLVSATGTGKTVMAAIDDARLRERLPRSRLLFVAHREEILAQSLATFRHCLRDHAFGELWVGGQRPRDFQYVFASIQSLNVSGFGSLDPSHFDVVIVDEFHHAAAPSYRALLGRVQPVELLGLTATPERSDGLPLLEWFDYRVAAELRLWDAIDQQRRSPFAYYGIHDGLDLREIPWRRGRGYDVEGLSNLLTSNDAWARRFRALLGGSRKDLERQIEGRFPFLPAGCHMELDRVAADLVLENIRAAVPSRWSEKVEELRAVARGRDSVTLGWVLEETGLELDDIYAGRKTFSDLRADAGLPLHPPGPNEDVLRPACGRLASPRRPGSDRGLPDAAGRRPATRRRRFLSARAGAGQNACGISGQPRAGADDNPDRGLCALVATPAGPGGADRPPRRACQHAEWLHSWAQKSLSERACQGSSHGSRAGFTSDHAMTTGTVPKTVPTEFPLASGGSRAASVIYS